MTLPNSNYVGWRNKVADTILLSTFQNQLIAQGEFNSPAGVAYQAFHMDKGPINAPCFMAPMEHVDHMRYDQRAL